MDKVYEPPWIAQLPRAFWLRAPYDKLPEPAAKFGDKGQMARLLGMRGRCSICGCEIVGDTYQALHGRSHRQLRGPLWTSTTPGPCHKSCTIYSVLTCPIFRSPKAKHRSPNNAAVGECRGEAKILGFRNFGYLGNRWAYWNITEEIPFTNSRELIDSFGESVATEQIDPRTALLLNAHDPNDQARAAKMFHDDDARPAVNDFATVGDHTYGIYRVKGKQ